MTTTDGHPATAGRPTPTDNGHPDTRRHGTDIQRPLDGRHPRDTPTTSTRLHVGGVLIVPRRDDIQRPLDGHPPNGRRATDGIPTSAKKTCRFSGGESTPFPQGHPSDAMASSLSRISGRGLSPVPVGNTQSPRDAFPRPRCKLPEATADIMHVIACTLFSLLCSSYLRVCYCIPSLPFALVRQDEMRLV